MNGNEYALISVSANKSFAFIGHRKKTYFFNIRVSGDGVQGDSRSTCAVPSQSSQYYSRSCRCCRRHGLSYPLLTSRQPRMLTTHTERWKERPTCCKWYSVVYVVFDIHIFYFGLVLSMAELGSVPSERSPSIRPAVHL